MAKLKSIVATGLAGYREISWDGLRPGANLLVGANGAGKSTLLEAIVVGLQAHLGRHSGDLLTGANPDARIELTFDDEGQFTKTLKEIRNQPSLGAPKVDTVLYFHEARRLKSRFGRGRSALTQHPTRRYEYVLGELQALLANAQDRALAEQVLDLAEGLRRAGTPAQWKWVRDLLPISPKGARRPVSCGQYDTLALLLDAVRMQKVVQARPDVVPFVILDNPDAFLHPALQQALLDALDRLLPSAQFWIASHSLKLVARSDPAALFWLSRETAGVNATTCVVSVRELSSTKRELFYELYGDDETSAVFDLALGLESTEYLAFLCASALPCSAIDRVTPERDPQVLALLEEFRGFHGAWTLVDFGAGAGDLLEGALRLGVTNRAWRYVAVEPEAGDRLTERLAVAINAGKIDGSSEIISTIDDAPSEVDAVVFANCCHAMAPNELAKVLAAALRRLRPDGQTRVVIHEVEVLRRGEHGFVLWTPEDYRAVFEDVFAVSVSTAPAPARTTGVPLQTTILRRRSTPPPEDLEKMIANGFRRRLLPKLRDLVAQRQALSMPPSAGLSEAIRQRRRAFLSEQCANIAALVVDEIGQK